MSDFFALLHTIRREDITNVILLFKTKYIVKKSGGWTALHWACFYNTRSDIAHFLIDKGCDIEAETNKPLGLRRRPLHLAASENHVDTVRLLISKGCLLSVKDKHGKTALDIGMKMGNIDCVMLIRSAMITNIEMIQPFEMSRSMRKLSKGLVAGSPRGIQEDLELIRCNKLFKIMNLLTGQTLLDVMLAKKNERILVRIKSIPICDEDLREWFALEKDGIPQQSLQMLQECFLFRCIHHNYQAGFVRLCTPDIVNRDHLFMGPTALETATEFGRVLCVKYIIPRLVNVDDSWEKAKNVADEQDYRDISSMIQERRLYLNRRAKRGYNRLHVAVFDNEPLVVEYILENELFHPDIGDKTVGSALSLAYDMDHVNCVQVFKNYKVNTNTVNKLKQSPLNVAIERRMKEHCDYLVDKLVGFESVDYMGFTALQQAVLHDCEWICDRLLKNGSRVDQCYDIDLRLLETDPELSMVLHRAPKMAITNRETIFSLCVKVNGTLYPCLSNSVNRRIISLTDSNGNTLLHLCAASLLPIICRQLLTIKNNVNETNKSRGSPLMELLKQNARETKKIVAIIETINVLVGAGASLNMTDSDECSILQKATELHDEGLMLAVIRKREIIEFIHPPVWRAWNVLGYFKFLEDAIPIINTKLLLELITSDNMDNAMKNAEISLVKSLYDKAKPEIRRMVVENFLYRAAYEQEKALFQVLIEHEMPPKISQSDAEPLLHCILRDDKKEFSKIIIHSHNASYWLNRKNSKNQLPIHICIELDYWDIVPEMMDNSTPIDDEDINGSTPLSLLLEKLSDNNQRNEKIMKCIRSLTFKLSLIYKQKQFDRQVDLRCPNKTLTVEVKSLWLDQSISRMCSICLTEIKNCWLNCGHVFCKTCAYKETECYQCRKKITARNSVFL